MAYKVEHNWREPREKLLAILKEVRKEPGNRSICQHVFDKSRSSSFISLFMSYAKQWELAHSSEFIIPSPDIFVSPMEMFLQANNEGTLWDTTTQYGIWRWELLDFVIAKLMQELE